jgi:hypothetical protein
MEIPRLPCVHDRTRSIAQRSSHAEALFLLFTSVPDETQDDPEYVVDDQIWETQAHA